MQKTIRGPWHTSIVPYVQMSIPVLVFVLGTYIHQVDSSIKGIREELKNSIRNVGDQAIRDNDGIKKDLASYNDKIFVHLTNDNIHTPKNLVVTQAEFLIYQQMREKQMSDLRDLIFTQGKDITKSIDRLELLIEKHIDQTSKLKE